MNNNANQRVMDDAVNNNANDNNNNQVPNGDNGTVPAQEPPSAWGVFWSVFFTKDLTRV